MRRGAAGAALVVVGVLAVVAGLVGRGARDDEGHHDGRSPTFALGSSAGDVELLVEPAGPGSVRVALERDGRAIALDRVHGDELEVYVVADDLSWFDHVRVDDVAGPIEVAAPPGRARVAALAAPEGGPDLVELGAWVDVDGDPVPGQRIADGPTWTDGDVTVRRDGFDVTLPAPWEGTEVDGAPAALTLVREGDGAPVHAHGSRLGERRVTFSVTLPGRGRYLAAYELVLGGDAITALFHVEV